MEEEVTAALEDDNVEEVQVLEIRFNQAVKEADERRGPEDYLHKWTIPGEIGGFKRLIFGDAAYLGAQKVVKWLAETAGLLPNTFKDLTAEAPEMRTLVCAMGAHSPLHYAVRGFQVGMVRLLLDTDANIDAIDYKGRTPLTLLLTDRCGGGGKGRPFAEDDFGPATPPAGCSCGTCRSTPISL